MVLSAIRRTTLLRTHRRPGAMPQLLSEFSKARGCPKSGNLCRERCKLRYDMPSGEPPVSRVSRLAMRPQPVPRRDYLSRTSPNAATCFASAGAAATLPGPAIVDRTLWQKAERPSARTENALQEV